MSQVFISYSHQDEDFVTALYQQLKGDGIACFFDKVSIEWGDNWVLKLEEGLDQCDIILLVLTPEFCKSEWTQLERTSIYADDPAGIKKKIRPLLLKECKQDLPRFLKAIQQIDVSSPEKYAAHYPHICQKLGGTRVTATDPLPPDGSCLPPLCRLPEKNYMPHRSMGPRFVGRVAELWQLDGGLKGSGTAVVQAVGLVVGMGGMGKSQLAVEYVHRFGCHFSGGVFWVDAEMGRMAMISRVARAAGIELDEVSLEEQRLQQLWQQLGRSGQKVLLVLDNFPEGQEVDAWLPRQKSLYTLLTSRRQDFFNYYCQHLDKLSDEEAFTLLNSGQRCFQPEETGPLIGALEGLPLALELVKHFLNLRREMSVSQLLEEMGQLGEMEALTVFARRYGNQLPAGHSKEVSATFGMGWNLATEYEREVLGAMAQLAPAPVPRRLLRRILAAEPGSRLRDPVDEAVSRLHTGLSMLELDEENDPRMHRLIAAYVRWVMAEGEKVQTTVVAVVLAELDRVRDAHDTGSLGQLEKVLPHGEFLLRSQFIEPGQAVAIANCMGWHHEKWGRYRLGEGYRREALTIAEGHYPVGDPVQ